MSHPAWGAWIEIVGAYEGRVNTSSRTPHGVRGLKYAYTAFIVRHYLSHPAWGAWIELAMMKPNIPLPMCRTPHGVRGLK